MPSYFEQELGYILMDFSRGKDNYADANRRIKDLILRCLGFGVLPDYEEPGLVSPTESEGEDETPGADMS